MHGCMHEALSLYLSLSLVSFLHVPMHLYHVNMVCLLYQLIAGVGPTARSCKGVFGWIAPERQLW